MAYRQRANILLSEVDNTTDRITTRKMRRNQEISRLALGEIGNRVSAIKIDNTKDKLLEKDTQIKNSKLTSRPTQKLNISSKPNVSAENKQAPVSKVHFKIVTTKVAQAAAQVENMPNRHLLPDAPKIPASDAVLTDTSHNVAPMDISGDEPHDFFKHQFVEQVKDIDKEDEMDPQQVTTYVNSIYSYMRHLEQKYSIRPNFLQDTELKGKMRAILIDWLCRVHLKFRLLQETFYITVAIVDRYLQVKPCRPSRLQLIGVTAMLIASKYEEMYAPEVADFVYITDDAYTRQDVRDMEQDILRTLDYSLGRPHCLHFLRRNSKAGQIETSVHLLAKYLMELAAIEYGMVHVAPSLLAAAALHLSLLVHDVTSWSPTLQFYSSYSVDEMMPVVHSLAQLVVKAETSSLTTVKTKYSNSAFMKIALIPQLQSKTVLGLASAQTPQR